MKYNLRHRMTMASTWYDEAAGGAREYELHTVVARRGRARTIRRHLARRMTPHFQQLIYRRLKRWIPKHKIKIGFEREEIAEKGESKIRIEGRSMLYRGKRWWAHPLGRWEMSYAKRRRTRKSSQGKRAKD